MVHTLLVVVQYQKAAAVNLKHLMLRVYDYGLSEQLPSAQVLKHDEEATVSVALFRGGALCSTVRLLRDMYNIKTVQTRLSQVNCSNVDLYGTFKTLVNTGDSSHMSSEVFSPEQIFSLRESLAQLVHRDETSALLPAVTACVHVCTA
eukprot:7317-Heterococcus_DN1.PRE.16